MPNTLKLASEFNRYFTSSNGVDVPERVSVSRDEWRQLFAALSQQPATPEPVAWLRSSDLADLRTCNYRHIGADSPAIWAPNDVSTPSPDMGLIPVYAHPAPSDDVVLDAARYRWLRKWKGQEHEPPFTVQHEFDGTIWGGDLDSAIDAAMLAAKEGGA